MGAWGIHFDQEDESLDIILEAESDRDWSFVETTITEYVESDGYELAGAAIGALELIAAALGEPSDRLDAKTVEWCQTNAEGAEGIREKAIAAIETILESSELAELWAESDENEDWREQMRKLQRRLQG